MFKKVNPRQNFPEMEKEIMNFWKEDKIFEKSVNNKNDKKTYSFFDGPPFATGLPHYGHVVASLIKDVVPRFQTMKGNRVNRRWGWDCHGLPIENLIEKEQNIKNKQEIEDMGIDKFNEACHSSVLRYAEDWKKFIPRIGRWVDMENDYRTMDWKYTESIWWVFSELYKKGLVYEGHKAMHICPRCETTLSNFEVTQGYKEITDLSATVKFKLKYPAGKTGRGVGALICNDKNEVLLLRRNENGRRKTWAMPGGKIDGSETFREALEREVDEELGVKIESAEPFVAKPDIFEGRLFETVCYKVKIKGEPTIKEKNKIDKLEWFALDNLPEVDYPPSRDALEAYKQNKENFYIKADVTKPLVNVYVLAWTTTPWTLPGNVALAVGDSIKYKVVSIKGEDSFYVLAKDRVEEIFKDKEFEILNEIDGKELVGLEYEPLFGYLKKLLENQFNTRVLKKNESEESVNAFSPDTEDIRVMTSYENNAYKIYSAKFVTTEEGAGIVHIAPAFGDDDYRLKIKNNLPMIKHVSMDGRFIEDITYSSWDKNMTDEFIRSHEKFTEAIKDKQESERRGKWVGIEVKSKGETGEKDSHMKADIEIIKYLAHNNFLFSKKKYEHSYPHCWRCDTPLINYATSSWFVKVTKIKERMVENNKQVNWTPEYIKEGRFGKWLEDARDWAVSRSRYWGAPLPIWRCEKCENIEVINSIDDLREKTDEKITKFILVRHGESESSLKDIAGRGKENNFALTSVGIEQAQKVAEEMKDEKIDIIFSSPVLRAKQTAEILNEKIKTKLEESDAVAELNCGSWDGIGRKKLRAENEIYRKYQALVGQERFDFKLGDGESKADVQERIEKFVEEIIKNHQGENVMVVCHTAVMSMFSKVLNQLSLKEFYKIEGSFGYLEKEVIYLDENKKPFNLHKPNIDGVKVKCSKCQSEAKIVGDVFDCWFESGSMPYAQYHYPFENQAEFEKSFPADFIAEGLDQTRGWFYTLMVLSTALFDKAPFKNVIVNGMVLAEDGQKMSKRLKNYPEPNLVIEKYGADALRYYLLSSPIMKGESLRFSEKGVEEVLKKFILTLWNTYSFLVMNVDLNKDIKEVLQQVRDDKNKSDNLLDKWILSELNILIEEVNEQMGSYDLVRASRPLREFIDKLSNWYVRRSRKRFVSENTKDKDFAFQTLYYVLVEYSKLMAPFMPFVSEEIYKNLTGKESVHLEDYPAADKNLINEKVSNEMNFVRQTVTLGLAIRAKNSLKVRQPLSKLKVKSEKLKVVDDKLVELIKDELNVKEVEFVESMQIGSTQENGANSSDDNWICDDNGKIKVALNVEITEDLKLEGQAREIVRHIQVMRKEAKYDRDDKISVEYSFTEDGEDIKKVFDIWRNYVKKECLAEEIMFGEELNKSDLDLVKGLKVGDGELGIGIKKV